MTTDTSTDVARLAAGTPARAAAPQTVLEVFTSESFKQQVALALPKSIDVNQMMRIVQTEVRMNADLQKCTPASFMGALLKAAQSGLRPGMFGEGWIIPRWSGKLHSMEAQFQPGYQGLAQLAYRSGEVAEIHAFAVFAADHFKYQLGSDPKIEHVPDMTADHRDEDIVAFYAVVKLTNGGTLMKVMRRADVDDVRDRFGPKTKAGKIVGPWASDYEPMGCKTVLIQCLKLAPKDSERLQAALQADNDAVFGDRMAASVVDTGASVADRVAARIGADVDEDTGEVYDGEAYEDAQEPDSGAPSPQPPMDSQTRQDEQREAAADVTPIRPPKASKAQLDKIAKLYKSSGMYEAEFASVIDTYGDFAAPDYGLTGETAGFVLEAMNERAGA
jgi:recombination protein RecT